MSRLEHGWQGGQPVSTRNPIRALMCLPETRSEHRSTMITNDKSPRSTPRASFVGGPVLSESRFGFENASGFDDAATERVHLRPT